MFAGEKYLLLLVLDDDVVEGFEGAVEVGPAELLVSMLSANSRQLDTSLSFMLVWPTAIIKF
jgi:hypothetical protein